MSEQVKAALIRAAILLVSGALTGAGTAVLSGSTDSKAIIAGALAGAGAARAAEGFYDSWRQSNGIARAGDVTPPPATRAT